MARFHAHKEMKNAGSHLHTEDVFCSRGQVIELFVIRQKSKSKFIEFHGTYNNYSDVVWSSLFNPTTFSRKRVETIRKNTSDKNDFYQGIPVEDLEFVRFSLSESPEVL
jgi:hypothetical protein